MQCYYHKTVQAVGICKNCQRGLCKKCAEVVGDALACRGDCEDHVALLNQHRGKATNPDAEQAETYRRAAKTYLLYAVCFFVAGGLLLQFTVGDQAKVFGYVCLISGAALLVGTFRTRTSAVRIEKYRRERQATPE